MMCELRGGGRAARRPSEDAGSGTRLLSKGANGHGQAQHAADVAGVMRGRQQLVGAAGLGVFRRIDYCY